MSLTREEAESLASAIIENEDILTILQNVQDINIRNKSIELNELINDINPNNPESETSLFLELEELAKLSNEIETESKILQSLYNENERERIEEEKETEESLTKVITQKIEETDIYINRQYDLENNKFRKELTTKERSNRKTLISNRITEILNYIVSFKNIHIPNGNLDLDYRKVNIFNYIDVVYFELNVLNKTELDNILIRSNNRIYPLVDKIQELINYYNDWDTWNINVWRELIELVNKLKNLINQIEIFKIELSF
jgi:hypothetical protein